MMLPVSFILESAVIPRFHERAVELEKSGGIGESRANKYLNIAAKIRF